LKYSLAKLLLALSLVANPVAVLASDFHTVEMLTDQATQEAPCHPDCEMPCCENQDCSENCDCVLQYSTALFDQKIPKLKKSTGLCFQKMQMTAVPDRELPPESPPPIYS